MKPTGWISALVFGLAVYATGVAAGRLALAAGAQRSVIWLAPLVPAVCALAAFGAWRRFHQRARRDLRAWREALESVGFEASNAVNAIRANLLDFRQVNPSVAMPQHLDEIEAGARRIAAILKNAEDPAAWHARRQAKKARAASSDSLDTVRE